MWHSHSSPVSFPFLPNLLAKGLGLILSLEPDDAELLLVEKCGFRVGLEYGLGVELWEWGCEKEFFESFFPEVPEFQFSLWVSSHCIQWMSSASWALRHILASLVGLPPCMTSVQSQSGRPLKYLAVKADSFQSTLATSFQNSTLYLTMHDPSFMVSSVRLFSASLMGSWGPKLTSNSLMKASKPHIQCTELDGSLDQVQTSWLLIH